MNDRSEPKLAKWPFLLGDVILVGLAAWVALGSSGPTGLWPMVVCFGAVALGAWLCATPFLREYDARLRFAEADALTTAVVQIQHLESIKSRIVDATSHWQAIQESAAKTLQNAQEISQRMSAQTQEFFSFFQRASDQEKSTLRLELEKMKRGETEWLQVLVRILDYVYALHNAGVRSGQPDLITELTQFQNACRDAARRIGLVAFCPAQKDSFDTRIHQVPDPQAKTEPDSPITEVIAPGFTFQTQLLRRALVRVDARNRETLSDAEPVSASAAETDSEPA